jgi:ubiquinone/menaquinone biosynthesis C-methylase UbiE
MLLSNCRGRLNREPPAHSRKRYSLQRVLGPCTGVAGQRVRSLVFLWHAACSWCTRWCVVLPCSTTGLCSIGLIFMFLRSWFYLPSCRVKSGSLHRQAVQPAKATKQAAQVVDVGGGTGFCTQGIVKSVDPRNVTLLDQSDHQMAKAAKKPDLQGITLVQGDAEDLPFDTDSFDRYVSAGSIEYWPEPQRGITVRPRARICNVSTSATFQHLQHVNICNVSTSATFLPCLHDERQKGIMPKQANRTNASEHQSWHMTCIAYFMCEHGLGCYRHMYMTAQALEVCMCVAWVTTQHKAA